MAPDIEIEQVEVHIQNAADRDEHLNAAVEALQTKAAEHGRLGILVTRDSHNLGRYTIALSSNVPFGFTYEASD